jgi:Protein of unknown function (DUF3426)
MFKCSRCHHIFPAPSSVQRPAAAAPAARARANPPVDESLTLPFAEPRASKHGEDTATKDLTVPEQEEDFVLGTNAPADDLTVPDDDAELETHRPVVFESDHNHEELDEPEETDEELTRDEFVEEEPPKRQRRARSPRARPPRPRSHIVPLFVILALIATGYGMLTSALFANPALSDKLVGRIPLIGTLGDERLLVRKVALSEVVGNYQRIKDGKDVFVITGKALNTAPVALQGVQIAGKLFDNAGAVVEQKVISCGNVISTKVLKDLTPQEVSILQKLSPPKKFVIEPGEASTFVIVFMDPPRQAVEFTTQVVAAQRQG